MKEKGEEKCLSDLSLRVCIHAGQTPVLSGVVKRALFARWSWDELDAIDFREKSSTVAPWSGARRSVFEYGEDS